MTGLILPLHQRWCFSNESRRRTGAGTDVGESIIFMAPGPSWPVYERSVRTCHSRTFVMRSHGLNRCRIRMAVGVNPVCRMENLIGGARGELSVTNSLGAHGFDVRWCHGCLQRRPRHPIPPSPSVEGWVMGRSAPYRHRIPLCVLFALSRVLPILSALGARHVQKFADARKNARRRYTQACSDLRVLSVGSLTISSAHSSGSVRVHSTSAVTRIAVFVATRWELRALCSAIPLKGK